MVFASFAINSIVYICAYRRAVAPAIFRMNKLTANKPLIWAVLAGFVTIGIAFWIPGLRELLGIVPLILEEWWNEVIGNSSILLIFWKLQGSQQAPPFE